MNKGNEQAGRNHTPVFHIETQKSQVLIKCIGFFSRLNMLLKNHGKIEHALHRFFYNLSEFFTE
ncbi:hypothetical protein AM592_20685 [Bacillus gobiensis]|uniref:Uncharacterized protein n=2 Tax=Bacillus TaxID=1386 RepID=A0A0M5JCL5_9BACI|nr:hypothetical protein AM592_20685 [Bacillus gobiensis]MBP1082697.1 hypothetical protein [Bacillus capparidis]